MKNTPPQKPIVEIIEHRDSYTAVKINDHGVADRFSSLSETRKDQVFYVGKFHDGNSQTHYFLVFGTPELVLVLSASFLEINLSLSALKPRKESESEEEAP